MSVLRTLLKVFQRARPAAPTARSDAAPRVVAGSSHDELIEQILAKFPGRLSRAANGRIAGLRSEWLVSRVLAERLVAAGAGGVGPGGQLGPRQVIAQAARLPKAQAAALGFDLPRPPRHLNCAPSVARTGYDLATADAAVWLIRDAGIDLALGGRYLHLDSGCGHGIRTLSVGMPAARWLGLDAHSDAVAWAAAHIEGAAFALKPAAPPTAEAEGSFDGVVAFDLVRANVAGEAGLEGMRPWLAELWRLVRPGGFLVTAASGYAALADLALEQALSVGDLAAACRDLDAGGSARLTVGGKAVSLIAEDRVARILANEGWLAHAAVLGRGPDRTDLYFVERSEMAGVGAVLVSAGAEVARDIDIVDARKVISGAAAAGLMAAVPIATAGSAARRPAVFIDGAAVVPDLRKELRRSLGQRRVVWPTLHLLSLAEPLLVGQGSVVLRGGDGRSRLLRDSVREFLIGGVLPDGFESGAGGRLAVPGRVHRRLMPHCLLLKRPWSANFGHWLVDQAMALSYLVHTGALPTRHIVVTRMRSKGLHQVMRDTLAAVLPDAIVHEHPDTDIWQFRHLDYLMPMHVPGVFMLPAAMEYLRQDVLSLTVPDAERPRRLYVMRPEGTKRALVNEPEIVALAARHGFTAINPALYSLAQQAALFRGAEAVMGVKGAALTAILFVEPSCRVMLLSPADLVNSGIWNIASPRGIAYGEVYGALTAGDRRIGRNDFAVDPAAVEAMIRRMLG